MYRLSKNRRPCRDYSVVVTETVLNFLPASIAREASQILQAGERETFAFAARNRVRGLRDRFCGAEGHSREDAYASPWIPGASITSERGVLRLGDVFTSSQCLQDVFANLVAAFSGLKSYLEIGAADPVLYSNTYVLERYGKWKGVSIELDARLAERHRTKRSNLCLNQDATKTDYGRLFAAEGLVGDLGYLSLDIDPAIYSLQALIKIPLQTTRFAAITFEHDSYRSGRKVRNVSRKILRHFGYRIIIGDVLNDGRSFEDWYIHPELVPEMELRHLFASKVDPAKLFRVGDLKQS